VKGSRARTLRRRLLAGFAAAALVAFLAAVGGCALFGPEFSPKIATPDMAREAIESRYATLGDLRIHYVRVGSAAAPTILFVHGSPGTWDAWRGYLRDPELRRRARLLALDRPGFGGSARGHAEPSLALQAKAVVAVLDAEEAGSALIVGHSLGGPIAARIAIDFPQQVSGLLLVAPSIDPQLERHRWYNVAGSLRAVQWFLPVDLITSNREIWPLRPELEALAARAPEVRAPTLVLQGDEDDLVPPANAGFVARAFKGAAVEVRMLPGASHFVLWEDPAVVRDALLDLLDQVDPEQAP